MNRYVRVAAVAAYAPLQPVWEGREAMEWDFGKISVVSRDGLISLKSLRGSGLDQDDIKHLRRPSE